MPALPAGNPFHVVHEDCMLLPLLAWSVCLSVATASGDSCSASPHAPPRHVALIPDGNRRYARAHNLTVAQGHAAGMAALGPAAAAAWTAGVDVVTFWWGSPDNLVKRDADEVSNIIAVLGSWLQNEGVKLLMEHDAELELLGRWRELASTLRHSVEFVQQALLQRREVSPARRRVLSILVAYDGQEEILAAAHAAGGSDRRAFEAALWTGHLPPADLVVRSAAAQDPHLSAGFMLCTCMGIEHGRTVSDDARARAKGEGDLDPPPYSLTATDLHGSPHLERLTMPICAHLTLGRAYCQCAV